MTAGKIKIDQNTQQRNRHIFDRRKDKDRPKHTTFTTRPTKKISQTTQPSLFSPTARSTKRKYTTLTARPTENIDHGNAAETFLQKHGRSKQRNRYFSTTENIGQTTQPSLLGQRKDHQTNVTVTLTDGKTDQTIKNRHLFTDGSTRIRDLFDRRKEQQQKPSHFYHRNDKYRPKRVTAIVRSTDRPEHETPTPHNILSKTWTKTCSLYVST